MSDDIVELGASDEQPRRPDSVVSPPNLPGQILASKRQELNWSVEDVAQSLHLAPRQIHAIEADNYSALPGIAITRGFIRSYAKLLKLDPAPLLEMLANETDSKAEHAAVRKALPAKPFYANRSLDLTNTSRSWARSLIWAVFVIVPVVLFIAWKAGWLPHSWVAGAGRLLPAQTVTDKTSKVQSDSAGSEHKAGALTAGEAAAGITPQSPEENSINTVVAAQTSGSIEAQGTLPTDIVTGQAADILESKDMLMLKLREDSWIEIRNSRNKVLLSRLAKAGESEAIPVSEPLKLVIGNAAGVDAQLRGMPVELNASTRNNVARLTVN